MNNRQISEEGKELKPVISARQIKLSRKIKRFQEKATRFLKLSMKIGIALLIIGTITLSYFAGIKHGKKAVYEEQEVNQKVPTLTMKDVDIAIDQSNRLMIIDKETGTFQMYSDTVGFTVFRMYAAHVINE